MLVRAFNSPRTSILHLLERNYDSMSRYHTVGCLLGELRQADNIEPKTATPRTAEWILRSG